MDLYHRRGSSLSQPRFSLSWSYDSIIEAIKSIHKLVRGLNNADEDLRGFSLQLEVKFLTFEYELDVFQNKLLPRDRMNLDLSLRLSRK